MIRFAKKETCLSQITKDTQMNHSLKKTVLLVAVGTMFLGVQAETAVKSDTSSKALSQTMTNHNHHDSASVSKSADTTKVQQKKAKVAKLKPQSTCPVMGGAIDKSIYGDHKGKRVYFCCGGCTGTFSKDPEKYTKKLEEMGQGAETIAADTKK
jgi:YHS domain-containing protein